MASKLTIHLDAAAITPSGTGLEQFRIRTTASRRELHVLSRDLVVRITMDDMTFHLLARHMMDAAGR